MFAMNFAAFDRARHHWEQHQQLVAYGWKVRSFDTSLNVAELQLLDDAGTLYLRESLDLNPLDQDDSAAVDAWLMACLKKAAMARNPAP
jgi:hypothetical protein